MNKVSLTVRLKAFTFIALMVATLMGTPLHAEGQNEIKEATAVGEEWLALIDQGEYGKSWDTASPLFQAKGTRDYWITTISEVRKTYGTVKSRSVAEAKFIAPPTTEVHPFIKVVYNTKLSDREIRDVVTLVKDSDGKWRASGY